MAHLAKDAPGIFVYKVMKRLSELYQQMDGKYVVYVNEAAFGREIRACVECFFKETSRHTWVYKPKIQDDDNMVMDLIKTQVCVHLAAAAEMEDDRRRYSPAIQEEFSQIWRYVREWLGEDEAAARGGESTGDLLAALKELVKHYDK
jgi:hypothetical protein